MDALATCLPTPSGDPPYDWSGRASWQILDTQFESGELFLLTWFLWRNDADRPRLLHFVAFNRTPPKWDVLARQALNNSAWQDLIDQLKPHWFGLLPGFHRISLDEGRVLLTLCIGGTVELLRQQHFLADVVSLSDEPEEAHTTWDVWAVKALARCCRRGTRLTLSQGHRQLSETLVQCGFVMEPTTDTDVQKAIFDPRWTLKNSRKPSIPVITPPGTCAVIGAGLAGASVAASLARRGWQVIILDSGSTPASGASGLPVGLVAPHGSTDDCQLSRLSRTGVRLMLGEANRLLEEGSDWAFTGSTEYRIDGSPGLPDPWSREGSAWSQAVPSSALEGRPSIRHHQSAWIKPASLVRAFLSLPNITFQGNAQAVSLKRTQDQWCVLDAQGQQLTCSDRVVFANATGVLPLLQRLQTDHPQHQFQLEKLPRLQGVRGQLTFGRHAATPEAPFPSAPINGAGSIIPDIPTSEGLTWYIGSSFQPETQHAHPPEHNHQVNFERLAQLKPDLATHLKPLFDALTLDHWGDTRCVTADRLPMVGPVGGATEADVWVCAGMGSRGLSFSVLCAELLAAQWGGEPLPIEFNLAQSFNALRAASQIK